MNNSDKPAYPPNAGWENSEASDLTKRELIAAMAMQGYISAGSTGMPKPETIASLSVKTADSLLAELDKTSSNDR